ncbi:MAG: tryptophan synthase subunit alpha [Anaerolineae bacterium]|nr:tryptophan synthase subunit alpha [Anaerolineae bacterium]
MNGINLINSAFSAARSTGRAALIPYLTVGYPDPQTSLSLVEAAANAGADLIELGLPFSDPLADGPTIQRSTQVALQQGITLARCIDFAAQLRKRGLKQPLIMMGYFNPLLSYGIKRFVEDAAGAGVDGFIIPDLPVDEAATMETACRENGRALVYLASPNTPAPRLALLAGRTSGFLYLVSVAGVTGARAGLPPDLQNFVSRARAVAQGPLAVGFGITTPEQAAAVGSLADGVIVGSALINAINAGEHDPAQAVYDFVNSLAMALKKETVF